MLYDDNLSILAFSKIYITKLGKNTFKIPSHLRKVSRICLFLAFAFEIILHIFAKSSISHKTPTIQYFNTNIRWFHTCLSFLSSHSSDRLKRCGAEFFPSTVLSLSEAHRTSSGIIFLISSSFGSM